MNDSVVLNYYNYPVFLVGGIVITNVSFFFKVDLWGVLFFVFMWFSIVLFFCFKGVEVLWLDKGDICFRRKFKVVSFAQRAAKISVNNSLFKPIEVVVTVSGRKEIFLLPGFIPEEQRECVVERIKRFCLEHNIAYL
ncbi:hypothetical protein [Pseudomonas thivervalensis]|uniref:hypothetical protein n=1 Tax=Pseudomonas thivervalensis TaxID=86265 RepID=UPI00069E60DB|nr:hypothetical protein [Pseudomonas thivervalensis]OAB53795.1 hypothetical protein APS14_19730 [Pseudomonas thivervalensis]SDG44875.1 hypothetical protein SAMN04490204_4331 [Pseudomonas thivervalensis]